MSLSFNLQEGIVPQSNKDTKNNNNPVPPGPCPGFFQGDVLNPELTCECPKVKKARWKQYAGLLYVIEYYCE